MTDIYTIFKACNELMHTPINLYGFEITLMQVIVYIFLAGLLLYVIDRAL